MSVSCRTIQILEPDDDVLVNASSGEVDESLSEKGKVDLAVDQVEVSVAFLTPKISADYEFDALYVEALGQLNPGDIRAVPVLKTRFGFKVELTGAPPVTGYVLRWRVKVIEDAEDSDNIDETGNPDSGRTQLIVGATTQTIPFNIPRSNVEYGFDEFRVENLIDGGNQQSEWLQVIAKTTTNFTISINPPVDTVNYFLVWRVAGWRLAPGDTGAGTGGGVFPTITSGIVSLVNGQPYIDVAFLTAFADANWSFVNLSIENTIDPDPVALGIQTVTIRLATGFRALLGGAPDSDNYVLRWAVIP